MRGVELRVASLALGAVLLHAAPVAAQVDRSDAVMSFAVIVGNNAPHKTSGEGAVSKLRHADDDAVAVFELLDTLPGEALLFSELDDETRSENPAIVAQPVSAQQVEAAVRAMAPKIRAARSAGWRTAFYFYYSGHGDRGEFGAARDTRSYINMGESYDSHRLYALINRVPADESHVIVDACHALELLSGRDGSGKHSRTKHFEKVVGGFLAQKSLREAPRVGVIAATTASRQTIEWSYLKHGIFTYVLLSAMRGGADFDGNGRVSYEELQIFSQHAFDAVGEDGGHMLVRAEPPEADRARTLLDLRRFKPDAPVIWLDVGRGKGRLELSRQAAGSRWRPYATINTGVDVAGQMLLLGRHPFEVLSVRKGELARAWSPLLDPSTQPQRGRLRLMGSPQAEPRSGVAKGKADLFAAVSRMTISLVQKSLPPAAERATPESLTLCPKRKRVAIMGVMDRMVKEKGTPITQTLTDTLDTAIRAQSHPSCYEFIDWQSIEQLLAKEQMSQMMGCDTESCLAEIGAALNSDYLFSGTITSLGEDSFQYRVAGADVGEMLSQSEGGQHDGGGLKTFVSSFRRATEVVTSRLLVAPDPEPPPSAGAPPEWEQRYYPAHLAPTADSPTWPWIVGGALLAGAGALVAGGVVVSGQAQDAADQYEASLVSESAVVDLDARDRVGRLDERSQLLVYSAIGIGVAGAAVLVYGFFAGGDADDAQSLSGGVAPLPGGGATGVARFSF